MKQVVLGAFWGMALVVIIRLLRESTFVNKQIDEWARNILQASGFWTALVPAWLLLFLWGTVLGGIAFGIIGAALFWPLVYVGLVIIVTGMILFMVVGLFAIEKANDISRMSCPHCGCTAVTDMGTYGVCMTCETILPPRGTVSDA